jgi:hypothetical protein
MQNIQKLRTAERANCASKCHEILKMCCKLFLCCVPTGYIFLYTKKRIDPTKQAVEKYIETQYTMKKVLIGSSIMFLSQAFAFQMPGFRAVATPHLNEYANSQVGVSISIGLDIQDLVSSSRLYIDGLKVEFTTEPPIAKDVMLPGSQGPYSLGSTGPLALKNHSHGKFISTKGEQSVHLDMGCWEMVWLRDRPAGTIVCGFQLDQDVHRNDAVLPSGNVYMNFSVYTKDSLEEVMTKKQDYDKRLKSLKEEQKASLSEFQQEGNLFKKALLWKRFLDANERVSFMNPDAYVSVPDSFDNVRNIGDDLFICTKGKVFIKKPNENSIRHLTTIGDAFVRDSSFI